MCHEQLEDMVKGNSGEFSPTPSVLLSGLWSLRLCNLGPAGLKYGS